MKPRQMLPVISGIVFSACMFVPLGAIAQTQPVQVPTSSPKAQIQPSKAVSQPAPVTTGKKSKYDRSYKICKSRAVKRGLKGVERRAFIRRCELGFAPPKHQQGQNMPQPSVQPQPTQPTNTPVGK
ncbi:hypothetical protein WJT86_08005 [Microvirga sp. W0021]|uniref:Phosphate starvation-inducible protein PsiF n=1 Tax=Hohaiivirga grylli TaxID=3133970 RepID=A0ABV0BJ60_9HYPH